jgi:chemotaxis protein CheZ
MQVKIEKVEALLSALKSGDEMSSEMLMNDLTQLTQSNVMHQVEEITQNLQSTLQDFDKDAELLMQTKHDLPNVSENLEYVIQTTEDASNQTLDSAENGLALIQSIQTKLTHNESILEDLEKIGTELNHIMSAQSFQDLTGQVLNRVMMLVSSLEKSLVMLIEQSGLNYAAIPERSDEFKKAAEMKGIGPNVTEKGKKEAVASQDDVDDLLGDLGL